MEATGDTLLILEGGHGWRMLVAGLVVLAALTFVWLGLRSSESPARRAWLLLLRLLSLAALALFFLQPALQERRLSPQKRKLALVVDASASMGLPVSGSASRAQLVSRFMARQASEFQHLAERFEIETYQFDDRLLPAPMAQLSQRFDGQSTDILAALSGLGENSAAGPTGPGDLAGVVLISDGADTAQLAEQVPGQALSPAAVGVLESLGVPVNTFSVGSLGDFRDLAINSVRTDDFAFIRNAVEIEVGVRSVGLAEMSVPLTLEQGGRVLASKSVRLSPGETRQVRLKFVPDRVGKFVYRVFVPQVPQDQVAVNNSRTFVTRIIRDKIRVLHLVGRPSWDERFLRQVLKRNPNVDLVSFFILRTTTDDPGVSQDELSLIPFPVAELFGTELPTFDVVVFQNFNHGPYQVAYFLPQLRDYIERGGAFLMIGGDLSFGAGGYAATPLADALPVEISGGDDTNVQEFRAVPSPAGAAHPILDLGQDEIFESLPPLGSFNVALGVPADAQVLLEHPFERSGQMPAPIVAIRQVGRGRTAAVLTDGTWRWNFVHSGQGGSPRAYHRFYNNLLRWLIQDPGLQTVSLRAERVHYQQGEPVRLSARMAGLESGALVGVELLDADTGKQLSRQSLSPDQGGRAQLEFGSLPAGAFLARLKIRTPGSGEEVVEEAFVVAGAGLERSRPAPRSDLLELISEATDGHSASLESGSFSELEFDERQSYRVDASTTRPLLSNSWVLGALIALLALEWWLRRRWGFA